MTHTRPVGKIHRQRGFTLLELVAVLIVLGVLAAVAVPTFSLVKKNSAVKTIQASAESVARNADAIASESNRSIASALEISVAEYNASAGNDFEDLSLEPDGTYSITTSVGSQPIACSFETGSSISSTSVSCYPGSPATSPGTPQNLTAVEGGSQEVVLDWDPPADSGGLPVTDYVVEYSPDGGETWVVYDDGVSATPGATVTGLDNGVEYIFRVIAVNPVGSGSTSTPLAQTPRYTPSAPTSLTATPASSEVSLSWSAPEDDGGEPIVDYVVQFYSAASGWQTVDDEVSASTSITITGLSNGTEYSFRVAAVNALGSGSISDTVSSTPRTVPGQPTSLTATPASSEVSLSWSAPDDDGGNEITGYFVEYHDGDESWMLVATVSSAEHVVTGLSNGTEYSFRVSTYNDAGTGPVSSTAVSTPRTTPGAPTALSVDSLGDGEVSLSWAAPSADGGAVVVDYSVQYSANGGSSWSTFSDAVSDTTSVTITGLSNGTEYSFRVAAVNSAGTGSYSDAETGTPRTVPGQPTSLTATPASSEVSLSWSAPDDDGGNEITGYFVEYHDGDESWMLVATVSSAEHVVTGLSNGTEYSFRVSTYNDAGTGPVSSTAVSTPRTTPGAPTVNSLTPGNTTITVAFTAPASNGGSAITSYEYIVGAGSWTAVGSTSSPFTITGLTNGVTYSVQLRAVNAAGSGTASSAGSATPRTVPSVPYNLSVSPLHQKATLIWSVPTSNGGATISDYAVQYSSNSGSTWTTFVDGVSSTASTTVTGLTNGINYAFRVAAINAAGTGTYSSSVYATPVWTAMSASCTGCTSTTVVDSTDGRTYRQYTFTVSGTMTISNVGSDALVKYLLVGGGAGGGTNGGNGGAGGSGGVVRNSSLTVYATTYTATAGAPGVQSNQWAVPAGSGGSSSFSSAYNSVSVAGGCGGAAYGCGGYYYLYSDSSTSYVSGGNWVFYGGGGGAGAGGNGSNAPGNETGGAGGPGRTVWGGVYGAGGGGGGGSQGYSASGGYSGGGQGRGYYSGGYGASATGYGNGGGGGYFSGGSGSGGIVIIRYAITE
jgi:titin